MTSPSLASCPPLVLLDFETTGLDPNTSEIIEIGAIRLPDGARFETLVKPKQGDVPAMIERLTGITNEMLVDAPTIEEVIPRFLEFTQGLPFAAHNASMEQSFLDRHVTPHAGGLAFDVYNTIDPIALALPALSSHSMESMRIWAGVTHENAHRALADCEAMHEVLAAVQNYVTEERAYLGEVVTRLLPDWWWRWFFSPADEAWVEGRGKPLVKLIERTALPDLRALRADDEKREGMTVTVQAPEVDALYSASTQGEERAIEDRPQQRKMSELVLEALRDQRRVAIEAPTGTGKSIAYLLPGVMWAREAGVPLVVSTHSKSLQDQLLEKDIPAVKKVSGVEDLKANTVKGQENYLCLRKLNDWVESLSAAEHPLDERWCGAFLVSFHHAAHPAELDRVSAYLKHRFEPLSAWLERTRSHYTTTIGPGCSFYSQCHFYDSARLAHGSDVVVANHALVFQWPSHLPTVRSIVFDEAHHLEDRLTEAFSTRLSEVEVSEWVERLTRRRGGKRADDLQQLGALLTRLELTGPFEGRNAREELEATAEKIKVRVNELRMIAPGFVGKNPEGQEGYEETRPLTGASREEALIEGLTGLLSSCRDGLAWFEAGIETANRKKHPKTDPILDLLASTADRLREIANKIDRVMATDENMLRLLHWEPREQIWKFSAQPIQVGTLAQPFFRDMKGVVLTSATLSSGANPAFVTDRIGLELSEPLTALPSPYALEKQARLFIPSGLPQPGTPAHLDSLIRFTAETARLLGGRTLLLVSSNRRLRYAADALSAILEPEGITVLDSLTDRRASETFQKTERALLIGGERYGEGLDIPGRALSCVIIEKINEAMTRGPLAEARKARTKFALYDFDFPMRMIWLKQRVGRLIRSPSDTGAIVVYDSRFHQWSPSSRTHVVKAVQPIPTAGGGPADVLRSLESLRETLLK